ncbi:rhomboid family protein [Roseiarcus fermentans]|uniref:Rhomboid family protein n=1 Tax=Roseiarcus fermentans TaxID=1473586 RepID=A0A366FRZ5_9HYPH|nr:rhomboid family intramembrane serine protease [Roseiarcus fermentans]RBP16926.1 rhomboid family protein [Roseiarcus fermentans]
MDRTPPNAAPPREPIFNAPPVVVGLAVLLIALYTLFTFASPLVQDMLIRQYAFVPGRLTVSVWPGRAIDLLVRASSDPNALDQARAMRDLHALGGGAKPWTLVTYAFLHGAWSHVLLNTIWLVAFGPPVARRFGASGFLVFMGVTAIAAALAHWALAPMDFMPLIGASGADSGLMGAATRFMFQPGAPLGPAADSRLDIATIPAGSLRSMVVESRPRVFLVIWFGTNLLFGAFARTLGLSDMPVAWIAHVGGFVAGLLIFPLFDRPAARAGA